MFLMLQVSPHSFSEASLLPQVASGQPGAAVGSRRLELLWGPHAGQGRQALPCFGGIHQRKIAKLWQHSGLLLSSFPLTDASYELGRCP